MDPTQSREPRVTEATDVLKQLWDEYKYRHELCWKIIVQITAASVALAILPYVNTKVTGILKLWVLPVPALAVVVVAFGALVIENELDVLDRVKDKYRELQALSLGIPKLHHQRFRRYVRLYIAALLALGLLNIVVLVRFWIPA